MGSTFSQIVTTIIVFIVTFGLNLSVDYLKSDNGSVRFGNVMLIDNIHYKPINIENYSKNQINKLKLSIPKDSLISSLVVSEPLEVKTAPNSFPSKDNKIIEISSIPSNSITRILIPIRNGEANCCKIMNSNELRLSTYNDNEVNNRFEVALFQSITTSIISSIMFVIFMFLTHIKIKEFIKKEEEISLTLDSIREANEYLSKRSEEIKETFDLKSLELMKLHKRQRIYLLKRITEYSKEINYWRNTFRKISVNNIPQDQVNYLFRDISKSLKTYSTHGNIEKEYSELEVMLNMKSCILEEEIDTK